MKPVRTVEGGIKSLMMHCSDGSDGVVEDLTRDKIRGTAKEKKKMRKIVFKYNSYSRSHLYISYEKRNTYPSKHSNYVGNID